MKGLEIFVHSVRLVFSNLDAAFRLSAVPYAISALTFIFFGASAVAVMETESPQDIVMAGGGLWLSYIVYVIVSVIVALWIAVSWHRYVLLEEYPTGWMPKYHGVQIWSYFVKGFVISLAVFGVAMVSALILGLLLAWTGGFGAFVIAVSVIAIASYLFYRLCPALPAAAVGKPLTLTDAWATTKNQGETIAVLVVLVIVFSFVLQLPSQLAGPDSAIGIVLSLVIGWITMLIGVSVLTTFYGHFVEGRDIN